MEGGGERKRKAGSIVLDWDVLLPSKETDGEPPPAVVVIDKAGRKSEPPAEFAMDGEEEYISRLSDKDLIEKIQRVKSHLGKMKLIDGGEKLRVSLRKHEAELERRKLLKKDGDKWKKVISIPDESTYTGATDDLSPHGGPPSLPASQSTFASHFCDKLDDRSAPKSFGEELSTLNCPNFQNTREKKPFPVERTQKIGPSSRQEPFKGLSHLSLNGDDRPLVNGDQLRRCFSQPLPCQSDKDVSGCYVGRENAPHFQAALDSRRNKRKTVVLVDEEELEVDETNQAVKRDRSKDTRIYYPSRDDPESIEIRYSDMECLAPESYLSSAIMNFYIRYLQNPTPPRAGKRCDYHFFNTYFYNKLKSDVLAKPDRETSFVKFRRWWKGVNIFEKAYIFLPIHDKLHWSLVIICIPNKEDESGPIVLHLDSLELHSSKSIFNDVKSFLIEEWKFLKKEEVLPELPITDKIWDKLSRRIDEKVIEVPQQRNEYDCGLFVLFFIERFIEDVPERLKRKDLEMFGRQWFKPEEASSLRRKIRGILREEFKNANEGTCRSEKSVVYF